MPFKCYYAACPLKSFHKVERVSLFWTSLCWVSLHKVWEFHHTESHSVDCRYAEWYFSERSSAKCHYSGRYYAERHGTLTLTRIFLQKFSPKNLWLSFPRGSLPSTLTGKSYWKGRLSTVDLLVLTTLELLPLIMQFIIYFLIRTSYLHGRHDTQHNDIRHNDNQHRVLICDTQHKWQSA